MTSEGGPESCASCSHWVLALNNRRMAIYLDRTLSATFAHDELVVEKNAILSVFTNGFSFKIRKDTVRGSFGLLGMGTTVHTKDVFFFDWTQQIASSVLDEKERIVRRIVMTMSRGHTRSKEVELSVEFLVSLVAVLNLRLAQMKKQPLAYSYRVPSAKERVVHVAHRDTLNTYSPREFEQVPLATML
jgi:hypothetical protein